MENETKDSTEDSIRRPARGPRVALAQISPTLGDVAANLERHRQAAARATEESAQLVVFPELSLTGYRLRDSVPDAALKLGGEVLNELAALSSTVAIVAGFVEESPDHLFYNSSAYFEGGKLLSIHRKAYLPTYGMFDEQRYFARGRRIEAFDSQQGRVAMLICEEMLHPSAPTIVACDGATMVLVPAASPARGVTGEGEADGNARSWEAYNHVIARTYGMWVVFCNRVGVEDGVAFWGGSEIVSPDGEAVVKANYYDDDYVSAVLADDAVRRRRIVSPVVRDEDLDLTINELARIRGRAVEADKGARREQGAGDDRRQRDRPQGGGFRGRDDEGNRPRRDNDDDSRGNRFDHNEGRPQRPRFGDDRGRPGGENRGFGPRGGGGGGRFGGGGDDRGGGGGRFGGDDRGGYKKPFRDDRGGYKKPFGGGGGDGGGYKKPFGGGGGEGGNTGGRYAKKFASTGDDRGGGGFKKPFSGGGDDRGNRSFGNRDDRRGPGGGNFNRGNEGGGDDRRGQGNFNRGGGEGRGNFGPPRGPDDRGGGGDDTPKWKGRPRTGEDTADAAPRERQRPAGQDERRSRPMRIKRDDE